MAIQSRQSITAAAFFALGLMGMSFGFLGTSLPAIRIFFGIDLEQAGLLAAILQLGFAFSNIVGGVVSDFFRRDKVLMTGCFFLGITALFFGHWPAFTVNLLFAAFMGIGSGLIVSASNALVVELHPERKGRFLNLHHVFFAVGSLIGPLVISTLLSRGLKWQYGYEGLSLLLLLLFLFFIFTRIHGAPLDSSLKRRQIGRLLQNKDFLFLAAVNFLAVGTQLAIIFLSVTFLKEAKGFSIFSSSIVLSSFFVLLALGRLACSGISNRMPMTRIILALSFFLMVVMVIAWKGTGWVSAIALTLSGLACSGIFPSLLALTGTLYHEVTGTALGILTMMGGLGGMFQSWFTGFVAQRTSVESGFLILILSSVLAFFLFLSRYKTFLSEECHRQNLLVTGGRA